MFGKCAKRYVRPETHKYWTVESSHRHRVSVQRIAVFIVRGVMVMRNCEVLCSRLTSGLWAREYWMYESAERDSWNSGEVFCVHYCFNFICNVNKHCYLLKPGPICYNTIIPPLPRLDDWSNSFRFHHQIPVFISFCPACLMCLGKLNLLKFILRVSNYLQTQTAMPARKTA